jgi:hypothetical protein
LSSPWPLIDMVDQSTPLTDHADRIVSSRCSLPSSPWGRASTCVTVARSRTVVAGSFRGVGLHSRRCSRVPAGFRDRTGRGLTAARIRPPRLPRRVPRPPPLARRGDRTGFDQLPQHWPQSRRVRPPRLCKPPDRPGLAPGVDGHGDPWRVADAARPPLPRYTDAYLVPLPLPDALTVLPAIRPRSTGRSVAVSVPHAKSLEGHSSHRRRGRGARFTRHADPMSLPRHVPRPPRLPRSADLVGSDELPQHRPRRGRVRALGLRYLLPRAVRVVPHLGLRVRPIRRNAREPERGESAARPADRPHLRVGPHRRRIEV